MPGWIALDGTVNMRDLGGLPTHDGGQVQPGRLIRSDNLQDLTPADVRRLVDDLGVTDVVDLRTHTEVTVTGPGPLRTTPVRHHHLSLIPGDDQPLTPQEAAAREDRWVRVDAAERDDPNYWQHHYLSYVTGRPDSMGAALEVIATSPGATLIHCAAGKDRTGTLAALALSVAGVPQDAVVADYVASGERIEAILGRLAGVAPYRVGLDEATIADQTPRATTMTGILQALQEAYGGAAGWLRSVGWTDADLDRLRARLTAPTPAQDRGMPSGGPAGVASGR